MSLCIVAEIGINHKREMNLAQKMIQQQKNLAARCS